VIVFAALYMLEGENSRSPDDASKGHQKTLSRVRKAGPRIRMVVSLSHRLNLGYTRMVLEFRCRGVAICFEEMPVSTI
jgi:hypothetical protein